jgi:HAD superfamily hydrolase (TIGR01490 family)
MKLVLFDFCDTLVSFQTADAFVDFVRINSANRKMEFIERINSSLKYFKIYSILNRLTPDNRLSKKVKLFQLKGLNRSELTSFSRRYYQEMIKPKLIPQTIKILKDAVLAGHETVLISAGYDLYLQYFVTEFGIKHLISSELLFKGDVFTGKLKRKDCYGTEKTHVLNRKFPKNLNGYESIEAYSDSASDIPLLKWATVPYVVSKSSSQAWASKMGCKEIIWK